MCARPHESSLIERSVVRLVVLDAGDRVLLLHTRDLSDPAFGTAWELPGGGIEDRETYVDAAVRELREETGLVISPDCVDRPRWRRDACYTYRGARRLQHEVVTAVRLSRTAPEVAGSQRVDFESEDHFGARWWTVDEIVSSDKRFYPRRLPRLLPRFLAGDKIEEPVEIWS
jgi:8-oxo-dGTP pyrophosphatase MutT (NUDIX family)